MKRAEKIINCSKYWFSEDQKSRTAVVMLVDKKEGNMWSCSEGTTREISHLIYSLMAENKELGHDIYTAACLYAHEHITAGERDIINTITSTIIEARKKPKGGER